MKERVFAAVREMKREQWLICGLAGLLLLVIAAPVKQKEQKKTQEKTTVSQTQEQTDDQIRQSYEKQLESVLSQVEGVGTGGGGDGIYREETGGKRQSGGYQYFQ